MAHSCSCVFAHAAPVRHFALLLQQNCVSADAPLVRKAAAGGRGGEAPLLQASSVHTQTRTPTETSGVWVRVRVV